MITADLPLLTEKSSMRDVIMQLAERRGIAVVCDSSRTLKGVITAGDLTRVMERESDIFALSPAGLMTRTPKTATDDELGSAVVFRMEKHGIMSMPVVSADGKLVGVIHLHDLMRAGVV
jgi:arabinose-5-phosphate isomerase